MPRGYRLDKLECPDLTEIEPKARRRIMRRAARVAAIEVRRTAPDSGIKHKRKLNKSIRYDVLDEGRKGRIKARVPHAHLVHDGTRGHAIGPPRDPLLARRAFPLYAGNRPVWHPGARANPFLVTAADRVRPEMQRVLAEGAAEALAEVAGG